MYNYLKKNQIVKSYQRLAFEKKLSHCDNTPYFHLRKGSVMSMAGDGEVAFLF